MVAKMRYYKTLHDNLLIFFIVAFSFFATVSAKAQEMSDWVELPHSKARLVAAQSGEETYIVADIQLEDGWKIYWREAGDAGFPTSITLKGENVASQQFHWPYPTRDVTDSFGLYLESYVYKDQVQFPIRVALNDKAVGTIEAQMEYGICKEICIPVQATLSITPSKTFQQQDASAYLQTILSKIPAETLDGVTIMPSGFSVNQENNTQYFTVTVESEEVIKPDADLFIEAEEGLAFIAPQITKMDENKQRYQFKLIYQKEEPSLSNFPLIFTWVNGGKSFEHRTMFEGELVKLIADVPTVDVQVHRNQQAEDPSIFVILIFAFIGGLILNIMPCVLPVLSIKLLGVLKHQDDFKPAHARLSFLSAAAGIVSSFLLLALLVITLKQLGMAVGWGFHFQQPYFIVVMVLILTFFACNLWGFFEFRLTGFIGDKVGTASQKEGMFGHFLTGVLATLLATPCTAPFLGTAVGFALSQNAAYTLSAFLSMGLGMAVPYFVLIAKPQMVRYLPKPGNWMVKVKLLMGVFLMLTAAWLIWVSAAQLGENGAKILGLTIALIVINFLPFMWKKENMRRFMIVSFVVLALFIPASYQTPASDQHAIEPALDAIWQPFNETAITDHVNAGKIVFVDVTADWCLTCQFNKYWAFDTDEVKAALSQENVIAMRADWTNRNDMIHRFLQSHQREGIPFNVIYSQKFPDGMVLPELLSKDKVLTALDKAR